MAQRDPRAGEEASSVTAAIDDAAGPDADNVIPLPERAVRSAQRQAADVVKHLAPFGSWTADDWGRDSTLVDAFVTASRLRWSTVVSGDERLPVRSGALIVVNARRFALAPVLTALALSDATGRPVRFIGRPDVAPIGALARRLGGLLARPDEVAGALRGGELVVLGSNPVFHPRQVGRIDHRLVGAAVHTRVRVFPAAVATSPMGRGARIDIGTEVRPNRRRRGPLAELELADELERRIRLLLTEFGGAKTGTPLDWLPLSGMGGS